MGGGGGSLSRKELELVEKMAKKSIKDAGQVKRNVFISFDHEDMDEVNLLRGQANNENTDLEYSDRSLKEPFNSENEDYIKRGIREKINQASVTMVYLTNDSAKSKWVDWEIKESLRLGKGIIGVHKGDSPPTSLPAPFKVNKLPVVKWSHEALNNAIERAAQNRDQSK